MPLYISLSCSCPLALPVLFCSMPVFSSKSRFFATTGLHVPSRPFRAGGGPQGERAVTSLRGFETPLPCWASLSNAPSLHDRSFSMSLLRSLIVHRRCPLLSGFGVSVSVVVCVCVCVCVCVRVAVCVCVCCVCVCCVCVCCVCVCCVCVCYVLCVCVCVMCVCVMGVCVCSHARVCVCVSVSFRVLR